MRCTSRLRPATVCTPFATPPTTNIATANHNTGKAAAAVTAAPPTIAAVIHDGTSLGVGSVRPITTAPATIPSSQPDASSPKPQSPEFSESRAKNTSATLSIAANRITAPTAVNASSNTRSRAMNRKPSRISSRRCPAISWAAG